MEPRHAAKQFAHGADICRLAEQASPLHPIPVLVFGDGTFYRCSRDTLATPGVSVRCLVPAVADGDYVTMRAHFKEINGLA